MKLKLIIILSALLIACLVYAEDEAYNIRSYASTQLAMGSTLRRVFISRLPANTLWERTATGIRLRSDSPTTRSVGLWSKSGSSVKVVNADLSDTFWRRKPNGSIIAK